MNNRKMSPYQTKQLSDQLTVGCCWSLIIGLSLAFWTGAILLVLKIFGLI